MPAAKPSPAPANPQAVLEQFVSGLSPDRVELTRRLHAIVMAAHPGFDVAIKYNLLMYAVANDWRHWVVAIDGHPKTGVGLRFLYGVMLPDTLSRLRPGSSVLMTWDFPPGGDVDEAAVRSYVIEAVSLYPEYKANDKHILASARGTGPAASRPKQGRTES